MSVPSIGNVLNFRDYLNEDNMGCYIANKWTEWHSFRTEVVNNWDEIRRYKYATDTSKTTNSTLPWKNKTTVPKLCQISDNLNANYKSTLFPKSMWLDWQANEQDANSVDKRDAILNYAMYVSNQERFKREMDKLIADYIDYGNAFATVDWVDERQELEDKIQVGYVGPVVRRISPIDIVFNPTSTSFQDSPKIVRSLVSIGELKDILTSLSTDENREEYEKLWEYLKEIRTHASQSGSDFGEKDRMYQVDGYSSFRVYLEGDYAELLTFYGDIYDEERDEYLRNHVIMVVDRHKIISKKPNPSYFGYPPIFHIGWRIRQDNLWAMGPLENLIGLQYRIDHIENLKADVFDLITFPPLKVRGYVEDFEWGPFSRIYVGDRDSDVEILAPPFQVLTANQEIQILMNIMEEIAGAPKEAMGFRTPGEKTKYEVQRMENAASRIFQHRTLQFSDFIENLENAMMELARRRLTETISIPVFDNEYKMTTFMQLTPSDLTGAGRIKPVAAKHFAEKAEIIQNLTSFFASPLGQDPTIMAHFSGNKLAQLIENVLDLKDFEIIQPYVRISEEAEIARLNQTAQQQIAMQGLTPSGLTPDDADPEIAAELEGTIGV